MIHFRKQALSFAPPKRRQRLPRLVVLLIIFIAIVILWSLYVLARIGSIERSPAADVSLAKPADVGIVLGAAMWGDAPSPGLVERLQQALNDFKAGKFKRFLLSGGLDTPNSTYTEAEGMANYLSAHGISRDKMLLENRATSTFENLKFCQDMMKERGLKTAIIITHTYHGNRALEIARTLHYSNPKLSLIDSKVLKPIPNTLREILAYTKWKMDQIALAFN